MTNKDLEYLNAESDVPPTPSLRQLRAFRRVMSMGSVSAAADALNLTQPALSKQISSLEETLNLRLFNRRRGGALRTTADGLAFFKAIEGTLYGLDAIPSLAEDIAQKRRVHLRIAGTPPVMNARPMMAALKAFRATAPEVKLSLTSTQRIGLEDWVLNRQANFSLGLLPSQNADLVSRTLVTTRAVAILPVDHPLAHRSQITAADLETTALILPNRQLLRERIDAQVPGLNGDVETSSSLLCTGLARSLQAVALSDPFSPTMYPDGHIRVLPFEPKITLEYGALLPPSGVADPMVTQFLDLLGAHLTAAFVPADEPP